MRYFIEVSYRGTLYSGFQAQHNANTVQAEVEKAFEILQRSHVTLTGSSRTDAGVHALQNFFHFDFSEELHEHFVYKINAILPPDIAVKRITRVAEDAHCRFAATWREYKYYIYRRKNPFVRDTAFYFPYRLDMEAMMEAAELVKEYEDFTSFSKRKTQVKTFRCRVTCSEWVHEGECLVYRVKGNRFLRGMVRALTATMLAVGRRKITTEGFRKIIEARDCARASFAVPAHGLFLVAVEFPEGFFESGR